MGLPIALMFVLSITAAWAQAEASPWLPIGTNHTYQDIYPHLSYREDPSTTLDVNDLFLEMTPWQAAEKNIPNFGFTHSAYWFRLQVHNPQPNKINRLLEVSYSLLDEVDVYVFKNNEQLQHFRAGNSLPFTERAFPHRNLIFPLELQAQSNHSIYLRVSSRHGVQVPMRLWQENAFWQADQKQLAWQFLYYGLMLSLMLYNLVVAWGVREKTYLYYVATIGSVALFQMTLHGASYQYLWPWATHWNSVSMAILIPVANACSNLFCNNMLHIQEHNPRSYWVLKAQIILTPFLVAGSFLLPLELVIPVSTFFVVATSVIVGIIAIARWQTGELDARIFATAWNFFLVGCLIMALSKFALLPYNWLTENMMQVGSAIETILLSLALIVRINRLREERIALERTSLEAKQRELKSAQELTLAKYESQAKSDFLAVMSHEIRTPMNGVLGVLELLRDTKLSDKQSKLVSTIQSSGNLLLNLINDILDMSKIESGKLQLEQIEFNLHHTINDALMMYHANKLKNDVIMVSFTDPDIASKLIGDPNRLKQVIFNLLGNALKFTEKGHIFIHATLTEQQDNQQRIRIDVIDSGIGMSADQLDGLFQPFSQADRSTTRKYGGTGLGLSISKRLIEAMGGNIGVSSEPNKGSTFWFDIPVTIANQAQGYNLNKQHDMLVCSDYLPFIQFVNRNLDKKIHRIQTISPASLISHLEQSAKPYTQSLFYLNTYTDESVQFLLNNTVASDDYEQQLKQRLGQILLLTSNVSPLRASAQTTSINGPYNLNHILGFTKQQSTRTQAIKKTNKLPALPETRVLIAEDNPVNQMVTRELLKPIVGVIDVAENGQQALEKVISAHQPYHYIFMDCEMPEMDGYEATQRIRDWESRNDQRVTIIALTAHAFEEFREKALTSGMDAHLTKPVSRRSLLAVLEEEHKRSQRTGTGNIGTGNAH